MELNDLGNVLQVDAKHSVTTKTAENGKVTLISSSQVLTHRLTLSFGLPFFRGQAGL